MIPPKRISRPASLRINPLEEALAGGVGEDGITAAFLQHAPAAVFHAEAGDAVGHPPGLVEAVGDEDDRALAALFHFRVSRSSKDGGRATLSYSRTMRM